MNASPKLGYLLLEFPARILAIFEQLHAAQTDAAACATEMPSVKVTALPWACSAVNCAQVPSCASNARLVAINGTCVRAGVARVAQRFKVFCCVRCRGTTTVWSDDCTFGHGIAPPVICMAHSSSKRCDGVAFVETPESSVLSKHNCVDWQEVKLQENAGKLRIGAIPKTITVLLRRDLVDACKPGDDVTIVGYVIQRWRPLVTGRRIDVDCAFVAVNVLVNGASDARFDARRTPDSQFDFRAHYAAFWRSFGNGPLRLHGRDLLVRSICPEVLGMQPIKLALLLALIGGVAKECEAGTRVRGDSHVLLAGDAGTGKSQLLKACHKLSTRAVFTNGVGSTAAGLTAAAIKDSGDWVLEAGALVLADRGVCCIDEFASIRDADKTAVHEAMEQQTVSVAKAGIVCKLNTRCAVIAACNLSQKRAFSANTNFASDAVLSLNIASPLLSRFDLVFIVRDPKSDAWDAQLADFILNADNAEAEAAVAGLWSTEDLQRYVAFVKANCFPKITPGCHEILSRYYCLQRRADFADASRTTVRLLESLVRLSEAHARLMFKEAADEMDAIYAIKLCEESLIQQPILGFRKGIFIATTDTDEDSVAEFEMFREIVNSRLLAAD